MLTLVAYELVALGMRYVFLFLLILLLVRSFFLMRRENRQYKRTLRQLPDAGLVGEVVDLYTGNSYPLPREGMLGSGRSCDVRLPALKRREIEFVFRKGLGLRLIPIHRHHGGVLDGEQLRKRDAYALHGTILDIRGMKLRFRLFAGLDVPQRVVYASPRQDGMQMPQSVIIGDSAPVDVPQPCPPAVPPAGSQDWAMTWKHALLPQQTDNPAADSGNIDDPAQPAAEEEEGYQAPLLLHRRRSRRERRRQDEGQST